MNKISNILIGTICIFIIIGILLAGLWPFNFHLQNRVQWIEEGNGIHFYARGIAYSASFLTTEKTPFIDTDEITIEIWLESDDDTNRLLTHIITFFDSEGAELFTLAQSKTALFVIRNLKKNQSKKGLWTHIPFRDTLFAGNKRFVTVTSNKGRTSIYFDGEQKKSIRNAFRLLQENRRLSPKFTLGSALTGKNPWVGTIFGLAIYNRALSREEVFESYQTWLDHGSPETSGKKIPSELYLFEEQEGMVVNNRIPGKQNLIIPKRYRIFRKIILEQPKESFRSTKKDVIINILGFIPLGFILLAYLSRSTRLPASILWLLAILSGTGLSLAIELIQVYLPMRISSLTDLICNSSGTAIGVIIYGMGSYLRNKVFSP
ncbi:MAG: hypothetical protein GTN53_39055 [Candidatus Aminicenantes bacterium]|nr:hypothetical protein [Candidatus Aminicenantes bacterium]NIQ72484.1 hypothetical protein [Candidatus Aminicenantes bacterium]NIT28514.1 hypothetical protein [Candidatus Aminicenantes bacterium]